MQNPTIEYCEELVKDSDKEDFMRQARSLYIQDITLFSLFEKKEVGIHLITGYGGGFFTTWYIFRHNNGKLYFIFETSSDSGFSFSWRETTEELDGFPINI
jgi:hypothetical protein